MPSRVGDMYTGVGGGGWCLSSGVSAWGLSAQGRGVSEHAMWHTPHLPVDRILDTRLWKHYFSATTVAANNYRMHAKKKRPEGIIAKGGGGGFSTWYTGMSRMWGRLNQMDVPNLYFSNFCPKNFKNVWKWKHWFGRWWCPLRPINFPKRVQFQSDIRSNVTDRSRVRKGCASPFSPIISFSQFSAKNMPSNRVAPPFWGWHPLY